MTRALIVSLILAAYASPVFCEDQSGLVRTVLKSPPGKDIKETIVYRRNGNIILYAIPQNDGGTYMCYHDGKCIISMSESKHSESRSYSNMKEGFVIQDMATDIGGRKTRQIALRVDGAVVECFRGIEGEIVPVDDEELAKMASESAKFWKETMDKLERRQGKPSDSDGPAEDVTQAPNKASEPSVAPAPTVAFGCVVQADAEVRYEIHLDGKLVSSGKTLAPGKGMQVLELAATQGDHVLVVTAPGCEPWQRTIALASGAKSHASFRVELKTAAE